MARWAAALLWCLLVAVAVGRAPDFVVGETPVFLLTREEAMEEIARDDDPYIAVLSHVELEHLLRRRLPREDRDGNLAALREMLRRECRDWTDEERETMQRAMEQAQRAIMNTVPVLRPRAWRFIKTSGREMSGAYYTRFDWIVVPEPQLRMAGTFIGGGLFARVMVHETWHVFSRAHADRHDALFGLIGFRQLPAIEIGPFLERRRITNPDAWDFSWAVDVNDGGTTKTMILVNYLTRDHYDENRPGFLEFMRTELFEVQPGESGAWVVVGHERDPLRGIEPGRYAPFLDVVGRNTMYLLHAEEILAENVTTLVWNSELPMAVRNPELLERIGSFLRTMETRWNEAASGNAIEGLGVEQHQAAAP